MVLEKFKGIMLEKGLASDLALSVDSSKFSCG
jgi:hypothetical protein